MNEFLFRMPTRVIFGEGVIGKLPQLCKDNGFSRIFVVTGSSSTRRSPHLQKLLAATVDDLQIVEGVGEARARSVRESLARLADASILERFN